MIVLGIDPSTRALGYCALELVGERAEMVTMSTITRRRSDQLDRWIGELTCRIFCRSEHVTLNVVACEAAHLGANVHTHGMLSQVIGVFRAEAGRRGVPFELVRPSEWRKAATGIGNATYAVVAYMLPAQVAGLPLGLNEHELAAAGVALAAGRKWQTEQKIAEQEGVTR